MKGNEVPVTLETRERTRLLTGTNVRRTCVLPYRAILGSVSGYLEQHAKVPVVVVNMPGQ